MSHFCVQCPYCSSQDCEAEFCDVGVGGRGVQVSPYQCQVCGAVEIGPFDTTQASEEERQLGWYAPNSANLPNTVSRLAGRIVPHEVALQMYRSGLVSQVPFQL